MALGDSIIDPALEEQLYGPPTPDLSDLQPVPYSWVPDDWKFPPDAADDEDIRRRIGMQPGAMPLAGPSVAPPPEIAAPQPAPQAVDQGAAAAPALPDIGPTPPPIATLPSFNQPPAPQTIDALTGAGGMPAAGDLAGQSYAPTRAPGDLPFAHFQHTGEGADQVSDEDLDEHISELPPVEQALLQQRHDMARTTAILARKQEIENRNWEEQQRIAADRKEATRVAHDRVADLIASADRIASTKIDPSGGVTGSRAIAGILGAVIGGLVQGKTGSSTNAGMVALNTAIDRGIEAQKADLANQREGVNLKRTLYAEEFSRSMDVAQADDTLRLAALKHADDLLAFDQQNYDPKGTQALQRAMLRGQIQAAQQKVVEEHGQKAFDNRIKGLEQERKNAETQSVIAKNFAEAAKARSEANATPGRAFTPGFTVPVGFGNPFDRTQQLMGRREIGGKHEGGEKEFKEVGAQISTYGHVQDYWDKLRRLGDKIGDAKKTLSESAWKARRGTLESEYDAAKEALVVYLTKELGDKLTQGQLEAQAHRIPDRASVFEARDPMAQITAAQEDADRDFARDMNMVGINADPVITAAQQRRALVQPGATQELDAAQAAVAADPTSKDAQAELDAANQRVQRELGETDSRRADVSAAGSLKKPSGALDSTSPAYATPTDVKAIVLRANRAGDHYGILLDRYHKAVASAKPDDVKLGTLAHEVLQAGKLAAQLRTEADAALQHNDFAQRAWIRSQAALNPIGGPQSEPVDPGALQLQPDGP